MTIINEQSVQNVINDTKNLTIGFISSCNGNNILSIEKSVEDLHKLLRGVKKHFGHIRCKAIYDSNEDLSILIVAKPYDFDKLKNFLIKCCKTYKQKSFLIKNFDDNQIQLLSNDGKFINEYEYDINNFIDFYTEWRNTTLQIESFNKIQFLAHKSFFSRPQQEDY